MTNIYENLLGTLYKGTPYGLELEAKVGHQTKMKIKFDQFKIPFLLRWAYIIGSSQTVKKMRKRSRYSKIKSCKFQTSILNGLSLW